MNNIIKGKPVADKITEDVKLEVDKLNKKGVFPKLQIMRVGEKEGDMSYEKAAIKRMISCGIEVDVNMLKHDISQEELVMEIEKSNKDETVHGILIFRPLPEHIDENVIKYAINQKKDIDCFTSENIAKITEDDDTGFAPCTPSAIMEILNYYDVDLTGKNAVVLGRSLVVGKPISMLLLQKNATVTICHSKTKDIEKICSNADVLIVAIGRAGFVKKEFIKKGAIVIDVGINVDEDGNICGDVKTDECSEAAGMITPVPGGVGSVTTSVLAKHIVKAANNNK